MPPSPLSTLALQSPFSHHLGGRGARWAICPLFA
jgi:hypothetical protein